MAATALQLPSGRLSDSLRQAAIALSMLGAGAWPGRRRRRKSQRRGAVQTPPHATVTPTVAPDTVLSLITEISCLSFLDCFYV